MNALPLEYVLRISVTKLNFFGFANTFVPKELKDFVHQV